MSLRRLTAAAVLLLAATAPAAGAAPAPVLHNYAAPSTLRNANNAGEPSIGVDLKTDQTMYQANTTTARVDFSKQPPTWTDSTFTTTGLRSLDPILFTDQGTNRTFVSQLTLACSLAAYTDDDGRTYAPSQGCGVGTLFDHQTIGGGPFAPGGGPVGSTYPHAVYYCAQASVDARCALSRDGGRTFGPGMEIYDFTQCVGLHGHLKVDPAGTAYVPNFSCGDDPERQALVTSRDNGTTWTVDPVPDSDTQQKSDPHLGIGAAGTKYFGYQGADGTKLKDPSQNDSDPYLSYSEGHAWIAVKPAGSNTWGRSVDVGAPFGVKNVEFPEVFAGDDDRAAYAFLGTTTAGDDQAADFPGVWHLYVAYTYDAGATWTTVDATPDDPVQRGCIYLQGGSNTCRNLLDFNDITMDSRGMVQVAYADGCTGPCANDPKDTSKNKLATIARQEGGLGLLRAFDPPGTTAQDTVGAFVPPVKPLPAATATGGSAACRPANGLRSVAVRPRGRGALLSFRRRLARPVGVDVFQAATGRRVLSERLVARFRGRTASVRWNGRGRGGRALRDGTYFVRFTQRLTGGRADVRRVTLRRSHGRFSVTAPFYQRRDCALLTSAKLERAAFGGTTHVPLRVAVQVGRPAFVTVTVRRGRHVVKRFPVAGLRPGQTRRVKLSDRRLRRGLYRVEVSAKAGKAVQRTRLSARRL